MKFDVGSLEQLYLDPEVYGPFVVPSLLKRLPISLQMRLLDLKQCQQPDLTEFIELVGLEVHKCEALAFLNNGSLTTSFKDSYEDSQLYNVTTMSTASSAISKSEKKNLMRSGTMSKSCLFCKSDHLAWQCPKSLNEKHLCYNCFNWGLILKECANPLVDVHNVTSHITQHCMIMPSLLQESLIVPM